MILGICGGGGLGREILLVAEQINTPMPRWSDIVIIDDLAQQKTLRGYKIITSERASEIGDLEAVLAVGEPSLRQCLIERLENACAKNQTKTNWATLVYPGVCIPQSAHVGLGCVIFPGAFISCDTRLGDHVLLMQHASISHDSIVGDNGVICGHVNITGGCVIGAHAFIGAGAVLRQNTRIGRRAVVGLGSVVVSDVADDAVVWGNPARAVRVNDGKIFGRNGSLSNKPDK